MGHRIDDGGPIVVKKLEGNNSVERDCYGCMGASFGDCNRCKEQKK